MYWRKFTLLKDISAIFIIFSPFCFNLETCQHKKVGIFDSNKFPNSRFTDFLRYNDNRPEYVRITYPNQEYSWNTIEAGEGWIQVDLGEVYEIHGLDIRGRCWCAGSSQSYYYTKTFKLLYGLEDGGLSFCKDKEGNNEMFYGNDENSWNDTIHINLNMKI
ncbi:DgyrCDS14754 [Dimorphilus gyrociliatus]|uniref:DgyrCDS14754 n=1 Tax=Dimorphilus gyrociliatus TaxID=2664684 RepID=A0A7I8WER8_9ANNE|nr:DgyrCDS14754 [Dimorphilus gyrociliatus]